MHLVFNYLLDLEDDVNDLNVVSYIKNCEVVAMDGLNPEAKIYFKGNDILLKDYLINTLEDMLKLPYLDENDKRVLNDRLEQAKDYTKLDVYKMREEIINDDLTLDEYGKKYIWRCM